MRKYIYYTYMVPNYRDNLWMRRQPRKREEVLTTTRKPNCILLPRRDFDPSQTSTLHSNKPLGQEQRAKVVVAGSSSKQKACENHQSRIQPNYHHGITLRDRGRYLGKVFPSPDGQKVWLVTDMQLPQGSKVPKEIFASL